MLYMAIGIVLGLVLLVYSRSGRGQDAKDENKGWVDYDDLKETERLKERPGNYQVLAAVSDFFDQAYRIRPDCSRDAYPFQSDSKTFANREEAERWLDAHKGRNKLRQYNINIKSFSVYDAGEMERSPELRKKLGKQFMQDRFAVVRKRHPGRAVVVLLDLDLYSLQSKKIEEGSLDNPIVLYLIHAKDGWRVAWFEK
jgi:hypothetical protein